MLRTLGSTAASISLAGVLKLALLTPAGATEEEESLTPVEFNQDQLVLMAGQSMIAPVIDKDANLAVPLGVSKGQEY